MTTFSNETLNSILVSKLRKFYVTPSKDGQSHETLGSNSAVVATLVANLESCGFGLEVPLIKELSHLDDQSLSSVYSTLLYEVRRLVGADKSYKPMYPNFPNQVMTASDAELFVNAIMHYTGDVFGFRVLPLYKKEPRNKLPLKDQIDLSTSEAVPFRTIGLATASDITALFSKIATANTSLSESDKDVLTNLFNYLSEQGKALSLVSALKISQKETKAILASKVYVEVGDVALVDEVLINKSTKDTAALIENARIRAMSTLLTTATDVLRYVALEYSMSADVSLAVKPRFTNLPRSARRVVLGLLDGIVSTSSMPAVLEEVCNRREVWVRLAEKLHIGDYAEKFPNATKFFNGIKDKKNVAPLMGRVDKGLAKGEFLAVVETLKTRPGVFARALNKVLATVATVEDAILVENAFKEVAKEVSTPVLLQARAALTAKSESTLYIPKGVLAKAYTKTTRVPTKGPKVVRSAPQRVIEEPNRELGYRLSAAARAKLEELRESARREIEIVDNTSSEPESQPESTLEEITVTGATKPSFDVSSVKLELSDYMRQVLVARFSTLPALGNVYVDPTLTEQFVPAGARSASKAFKSVARGSKSALSNKDVFRAFIWWKDQDGNRVDIDSCVVFYDKDYQYVDHCSFTNLRGTGFTHSGDITSAPKGAAEFVDINKSELAPEIRYAVLVINSFTSQKYSELDECFAGVMERSTGQDGEIFDGRTVLTKFDLTSETRAVVPLALDIKENKMLWMDMALKSVDLWSIVEKQSDRLGYLLQGFNEMCRPSLYDLFMMHAEGRGVVVDSKEAADSVFSMSEGVTPFHTEVIASEYLAD